MERYNIPQGDWSVPLPTDQDSQFDRVISAFARQSRRPPVDPGWAKKVQEEAHKKDPKHIKALAKRRKAKRGGPR